MFCSVVIPTIGRETLSRAVSSVLSQADSHDVFEVIVVNDSGRSLPDFGWGDREQVRIVNTMQRERSIARNTGAAIARGEYLCFLDDDDWLLPGALEEFARLAEDNRDAVWLYGGIRVVDEDLRCVAEANFGLTGNCFAQVIGGAWIPIQASLIRTDAFFGVGGYDPHVCGTEDEDLCRRVALRGDFANSPKVVACLFRGRNWETSTNYTRAPEDTIRSRDRVVNESGAFARMIDSAGSAYWYGRILRVYLSTMRRSIHHRKLWSALSRGMFGTASILLAKHRVLSPAFWRAARAEHTPDHLHYIVQSMERESTRATMDARAPRWPAGD